MAHQNTQECVPVPTIHNNFIHFPDLFSINFSVSSDNKFNKTPMNLHNQHVNTEQLPQIRDYFIEFPW